VIFSNFRRIRGESAAYRIAGFFKVSILAKTTNRASDYIDVNYVKPFIQPSIGFSSKYFDLELTPRVAYLSYTSQNDYRLDPTTEPNSPRQFFEENHNTFIFEPGIMVRGGIPGVKLEIQYNFSTIREPSDSYFVNNQEFVSVGLRFLISERTSEKAKE
jgi:hypothetical protein